MKTHCKRGHLRTPENTRQRRVGVSCRICEEQWFTKHAEERKAYRAKWMREKWANDPTERQKKLARVAVQKAIQKGALVPKPCEVCGFFRAEAHHDDYTKPLQVRWLCNTHHDEHHRKAA